MQLKLDALKAQVGRNDVVRVGRRQTLAGEWCQVVGRIEEGETAWQTALREISEETGLMPIALYSADTCEQSYEADRNTITIAPAFVAIIRSTAEVVPNHEHSEYRWVSFEDAAELVAFGGQRRVLRWIRDEFVERTPSKHLRIIFDR